VTDAPRVGDGHNTHARGHRDQGSRRFAFASPRTAPLQSKRVIETLRRPQKLWTRTELLHRPSPNPAARGLYAWFFRESPKGVPVENCVTHDDLTLLYVGIASSRDSRKATICRRLRQHYADNAAGSTLRLTLGCLLGLPLTAMRAKARLTFGVAGERQLSDWMAQNAFVCWVEHPAPREIQVEVIASLHLH
jgi:hypothetical protein